jgi:predicted nucleic acid-binding protein
MGRSLRDTDSTGKRPMSDSVFLDTNLLIYYISDDLPKKKRVHDLLITASSVTVSSQVINEFVAVTIRKNIHPRENAIRFAAEFMELFTVIPVDETVIRYSFDLMMKYGYSSWDSLILAAALQSRVRKLYSEDLHHGQVLESRLTIINPFMTE